MVVFTLSDNILSNLKSNVFLSVMFVVLLTLELYLSSALGQGLSAESIPLSARIFAIVNVFDALLSERPYKKAFSLEKTLSILNESAGNHFDPALIDAFKPLVTTIHQQLYSIKPDELTNELHRAIATYFQQP